ncbi:hypothetical protein [Agreia sp. COWG]|uniref:hypothetical protein n=1 Tax=Agreia sp. COWG TaxID=2773266 RepID=UPI001927DD66|nr:hypothetical protein [Agreia sp. COWG]
MASLRRSAGGRALAATHSRPRGVRRLTTPGAGSTGSPGTAELFDYDKDSGEIVLTEVFAGLAAVVDRD